jgi:hypothetical protein
MLLLSKIPMIGAFHVIDLKLTLILQSKIQLEIFPLIQWKDKR